MIEMVKNCLEKHGLTAYVFGDDFLELKGVIENIDIEGSIEINSNKSEIAYSISFYDIKKDCEIMVDANTVSNINQSNIDKNIEYIITPSFANCC
jgi:hypothetical protein